mmetsp:Transcript_21068/g.59269  ORF Transcript_21068/g.59269 Transcript_21068/m.59269 type:complete len:154 (+) Transcript_21068:326-787(+)
MAIPECGVYVVVNEEEIDVGALTRLLGNPECGAISSFLGVTRNNFQGKRVLRLEYDAYRPLAEKQMRLIGREAKGKWPGLHGVAMQHRVGTVPVTEASVAILASSVHRRDSLEAVQWMIDELKSTVPIWKKEVYDDGEVWKENCECQKNFHRS